METIEKMNAIKEIQKAYTAHIKYIFHCENILQMAIDILESKGIDPKVTLDNFGCSYVPCEGLCFSFEINDVYILTCVSFFQYFEESYKDGDNIIEELLKIAIY